MQYTQSVALALLAAAAMPAHGTPLRLAQTAPSAATAPDMPVAIGYTVQISSQRNEADALASFQALQKRFPHLLGGRSPIVKRVDIRDIATFYRVFVGPFPSEEQASQLCSKLRAAGGACTIQRYQPPSQ